MRNFAISVAGLMIGSIVGGIFGIALPAVLAMWAVQKNGHPSAGGFGPQLAFLTVPFFLILGGIIGGKFAERRWK